MANQYTCPYCGNRVASEDLVQFDDPAGIAFPFMHPDPGSVDDINAWCGPVIHMILRDGGIWEPVPAQAPPAR
ncbi:MAG: hypothetical protein OXH66_10090 [Gemmatimonadetes bacterium]|nr:hypothetical protein [Gemmatimonadota bacterium]